MKYYYRILLLAIAAGITVSCADAPFADFKTEKPESLKKYEYLNEYGDLKTYINRTAHPNFKLGTGVSVSDFLKQNLVYALTVNNYDDVTAGNAMKYSSCVDAKGNMDFGTVKKFVKTAKEAGISIYGHTLCWHSQQQNTYLSGLIADKTVEVDPGATEEKEDVRVDYSELKSFPYWSAELVRPEVKNGVLTVENSEIRNNFYDIQYHAADNIATTKGGSYKLTLYIKGSSAGSLTAGLGGWGNVISTTLNFTNTWQEVSVELNNIPVDKSFVILQSGNFVGTYEIKWLKVTHIEATGGVTTQIPVLEDDFSSETPMMGWGNNSTLQVIDGVHQMTNPSEAKNPWDAQAGYEFPAPLTEGITYFLKMKIKGSVAGSIGAIFQKPDGYAGRGDFPSIPITTDWKEVIVSTKCTGDAATRVLFNYGKYVGTIYIDDLSIYWEKSGNTIPLTPEEKEEILTNELERWIKGMLESCDGYVKAWDVVNEPISGKDSDGDGYYDLQSASQPDDNGVSGENFYWKDYFGDDYARIPI
ncbi:MAG: endo-1,4-beta-xylanase, partial [Bacteroides sp.]|nr:endo-1,4-beta-xylanase [Bacteroides sp.]